MSATQFRWNRPAVIALAAVLALHLVLTFVMTYPAALVANREFLGIPRGDKFQFVWVF